MKKSPLILAFTLIALLFTSCKKENNSLNQSNPLPRITIEISPDIKLIPIGKSLYRHETLFDYPGFGKFPSNGLLFIKNGKALLVDTPPSDELTKTLYNYLNDSMNITISKLIISHSHADCQGGLPFLQSKNIHSIALDKTKEIALKQKLPIATEIFTDSLVFSFEDEKVICNYFGGGHTIDNITTYFPGEKVFFGGCLVKEITSTNLGYTKEAVLDKWAQTIRNIKERYTDIVTVVPGHGKHGTTTLLNHTISLIEKNKQLTIPNE